MRIAAGSSDTLAGRTITVTGFTFKEGARTDLAKIVIVCCAARMRSWRACRCRGQRRPRYPRSPRTPGCR